MKKDILVIENKPLIPANWDYKESIINVKQQIKKWKSLTEELVIELFIAREALSNQGARNDLESNLTWKQYCEEIGIEKSTANRWLLTYFNFGANAPKLEKKPMPFPKGKFSIIYADPPWPIESMVLDKWESHLSEKYPTMSIEELKDLKIENLAYENCGCFMWTTHTMLQEGLDLLKDWGFKYHCLITWDKGGGWSIGGFHRRTEFLLFGYKGILGEVIKQKGEYIPTLIVEKKTTHSTKPQVAYKLIEERSIGPKIELFARRKREGWDLWGNENYGNPK